MVLSERAETEEYGMTVEEMKREAKAEKETLAKMIHLYQPGNQYTLDQLMAMPLKKLRELHDKFHL